MSIRYDCSCMETEGAYITPEGYIRAKAVVTRAGVFTYANADGTLRKELRLPDDVFNQDALSSMRLIPVTNGHPKEKLVDASNSKRLGIGFTGENIEQDGNFVLANIVITDADTVRMVQQQARRELSLGYTVDLVPESGEYNGERYDFKQTNIKYNHLALVDTARAGSEARIKLDGDDAEQIDGDIKMTAKRKIKIDNREYLVEAPVADLIESRDRDRDGDIDSDDHIKHLEDNVRNLTDELERVRAERDRQKDELERARAERDALRDGSESDGMMKRDSADFKSAVSEQVKQRVKLLKAASNFISSEELERLDSASDVEIKQAVIKSAKKGINLDGKSEIYTDTMFDIILAETHSKPNLSNVTTGIKMDSKPSNLNDARQEMIAREKAQLKKVKL